VNDRGRVAGPVVGRAGSGSRVAGPWGEGLGRGMSVRQGVAMDSLKFYPGPPRPTLPRFMGGPPLKQPSDHFRGGPPAGWADCGRLLSLWTPHAVRLCHLPIGSRGKSWSFWASKEAKMVCTF
jgi:hypothetical protein